MPILRSQEEIAAEIDALEALRPTGPFAQNTERQLALLVDVLRQQVDFTTPEFTELPETEQMTALDAEAWRTGDSDFTPSTGWRGLCT